MRKKFDKLARTEHGTLHFIESNVEDHIDAYWGSRKRWEALPEKISDMKHFADWDTVVPIDHGYPAPRNGTACRSKVFVSWGRKRVDSASCRRGSVASPVCGKAANRSAG